MTKFNSRQQYNLITQSFSKTFDIKLSKVRHKMSTEEGFKDVNSHMASLKDFENTKDLIDLNPFEHYINKPIQYHNINLMLFNTLQTSIFEEQMTKYNIKKSISSNGTEYDLSRKDHNITILINLFLTEGEVNISASIMNSDDDLILDKNGNLAQDVICVMDDYFMNHPDNEDSNDDYFYNARTYETNCIFTDEQKLFINETLFIYKKMFSHMTNIELLEHEEWFDELDKFDSSFSIPDESGKNNYLLKHSKDLVLNKSEITKSFFLFLDEKDYLYDTRDSLKELIQYWSFYIMEIDNEIKFIPVFDE
jgi:hypothetical protein